jgi:hypothetical protein
LPWACCKDRLAVLPLSSGLLARANICLVSGTGPRVANNALPHGPTRRRPRYSRGSGRSWPKRGGWRA